MAVGPWVRASIRPPSGPVELMRDSAGVLSRCPHPSLSGPHRSDQRETLLSKLSPSDRVWADGVGRREISRATCVCGWMAGCIHVFFEFVYSVHLFSSPPSLRIPFKWDVSALHNSHPLPMLGANAVSSLPFCSEAGSKGVKVGLVGV